MGSMARCLGEKPQILDQDEILLGPWPVLVWAAATVLSPFWVTVGPTPLSDLGPYMKCSEAAQRRWDGPWVLQADLDEAQMLPEGMEWEAIVFLFIQMLDPAYNAFSHCPWVSPIMKTLYNICR